MTTDPESDDARSPSSVESTMEHAGGSVAVDTGPDRSIGRNIGALMSSQLVTWTLSTMLIWLIPRYLGADGLGSLQLANSIWAIAVVFATFGTSTLLAVEIARQRATFRSLLANSVRLRLIIMAAIVPIVAAVLAVGPYDRETMEVAAIVGLGALFTLYVTASESALYGLQEMGVTSSIRVATKVYVVLATLAVLLLGGRLIPVALVNTSAIVLTAVMFARIIGKRTSHLDTPSPLVRRTLVVASLPFLAAEATRVVYQQIDTVVMSLLVDREALGFYAAADAIFGSLLFVPVIVTTALFPAIADLHQRSPEDVAPMLRRAFNTLLLVSVPIGLGTIVVAPALIDLVLKPEFEPTASVLAVYGVVVLLSSQTILLGRFALATGRAKFWSALMIGATVLTVPLDIVLVPWTDRRFDNGAIGGALAYVVTEGLLIVVGVATIGAGLLTRGTLARIVRCTIAGALMLAVAWPLRDEFFVIPGVVSVLTYLVAILALRTLSAEERQHVQRAFSRIRKGRS